MPFFCDKQFKTELYATFVLSPNLNMKVQGCELGICKKVAIILQKFVKSWAKPHYPYQTVLSKCSKDLEK
jgi:hypothetical protein